MFASFFYIIFYRDFGRFTARRVPKTIVSFFRENLQKKCTACVGCFFSFFLSAPCERAHLLWLWQLCTSVFYLLLASPAPLPRCMPGHIPRRYFVLRVVTAIPPCTSIHQKETHSAQRRWHKTKARAYKIKAVLQLQLLLLTAAAGHCCLLLPLSYGTTVTTDTSATATATVAVATTIVFIGSPPPLPDYPQ
jgi:hypothetical protein